MMKLCVYHVNMKEIPGTDPLLSTLTDRGQLSLPARIRRSAHLKPGQKLRWEQVSESEFRVTVEGVETAPGPLAALGWARRFHSGAVPDSDAVMRELRSGEES
jgi:bifunctional DNA-binding transcriptional regulator/antitoxin component of YhaV-PrlF toxin-antitoxin module